MAYDTIAQQWRVPLALPILKLVTAIAVLALGVLFAEGDPLRPVLGGLAAAVLTGWGLRDLVTPVRLAVDATGITVPAGLLSRRHLPWPTVETIQVQRSGRAFAGPTLEIDAGDSLHLFSRLDLGTDPAEVAEALHAVRAGRHDDVG
ncbi:PH domain-containing protein [Micromonospora sp. DT48]|uniref:PH domain-containing protein n=1 Tax=unclassified Micromonospora TaxID=2617518 RepID=UPI002815B8D7|nr:PH domain-containing protein [Micromonospora sp. CP22]